MGFEPTRPFEWALAPQASASTYSATTTRANTRRMRDSNPHDPKVLAAFKAVYHAHGILQSGEQSTRNSVACDPPSFQLGPNDLKGLLTNVRRTE